jgi:hypothetical protein
MGEGTGYIFNDSALFLTGAMALSQSAYVSWGSGINDSTTVGFTQNANGTLLFKDNATGSWTELGNTRDNTVLGDASGDTVTFNAATVTIPNNLNFDSNTLFLNASNNRIGVGTATPNAKLHVAGEITIDSGNAIRWENGNNQIYGSGDSGTSYLDFQTSGASRVRIKSDGKVGLGVTDPDSKLEILSTSTQQKWSYDTDSFATLTVADASHTTLATGESGNLTLDSAGDIILDPAGNDVLPPSDNAVNLGSASKRWDHIHTVDITTGDLHMKNDRGDWTIVEEENYLCVVNNRTNKRYKMMLEEIED